MPRGRLDAVRLRLWTPKGSAGGFIDVVHSADVYTPDDEGLTTDWTQVVLRARERALRGGYDVVAVDTLGEWMGSDNNDAVLESLGACRQLTREGLSVVCLHHTPRADPRRPRGGGAIEAQLDIGWAIYGTGERWGKRSLHDPVRILAPFKSRFQDVTPAAPLTVEYRPGDLGTGLLPSYHLAPVSGAGSTPHRAASARHATVTPVPVPVPVEVPRTATTATAAATATATATLQAMKAHGAPATVRELLDRGAGTETGTTLDRKAAYAAVRELLNAGLVREAGTVPTPGGGKPSVRYAVALEPSGGAGGAAQHAAV